MQTTEENIAVVMRYIRRVSHMPGFPVRDEGIMATVRLICKFVHNLPVDVIRQAAFDRKVAKFGTIVLDEDEAASGKPKPDELSGYENDIEWLCDHILENFDQFPPVVTIRELYASKLPAWEKGVTD